MIEANNSTYSKSSSMAFAVITSLLEIVEKQLLQPNSSLVLYSREMVVSLSKKLCFLQAFLEEFGAKTDNSEANRESLEAEILDVAIEAESKVESELGEVYVVANRGDCVVSACQKLHQTLQQVVKDFEGIEVKILMEKSNANSLVIGSSTESSAQTYLTGSVGSITGNNTLEPENSGIVGFSKDIKKITYRLIRLPSVKRDVLTLVGLGGIGKTTLANMVYTYPSVASYFRIRAWAVVSKEHNVKEMLVCLLGCIVPMTSEISNKDEAQLAKQLCKSLMGHRYLIVLDDVWTTAAWDAIQECFPDNSNGSRILLTTRFNEVAVYTSGYIHVMKVQTQDDSWKLFSRKVFGLKQFVPQEYKSRGKRIIDGCYGLPLAIVAMAGLLATVKGSIEIWRDVAESLDGIMDSADNRISRILSLSYNYLPTHLKACLLYFGVFREDSDIHVKKLISLWVAEGFLKSKKKYKSMEKQAESCLHDLINRSLVQANELSIDGKIKSCKVHDRLHEFCMREAKKENFLSVINENHSQEARRWISFQSRNWPITRASYEDHTFHKIRSIIYSGNNDLYISKCRLVYPHLKLLRVLDLSLVKYSHNMPSGIADLIHLRYLALNTIGSLYKFRLFKLQNLQTLAICSWMEGYPLQLPFGILDLPQLRHLHLERKSSQCLPSLVQGNLLTLYWLRVGSFYEKPNFRVVPNLKELGIYVEGEMTPSSLESLVHLRRLEKLKFDMGRVERFYLPSGFPPNLKKLTFRYTYLSWEETSIIGKLPNLEVLKLKDFAFCGPEWEPTKRGFRGLKVLLIERLDLKHWNANAEHFPTLELLILRHCWDLKRVPVTFANIKTLKSIVIEDCYSSLVTSAHNIANKVQRKRDGALRIRDLGTKVGLSSILIHNSELLVLCLLI